MALTYQLIVLLGLSSGLWMGANAACDPDCCLICPGGWIRHDGRCYQFVNHLKGWGAAEKSCNARGGNLASVHTEEDLTFVRKLARPGGVKTRTWLGANEEIKPNSWKWADGSEFPDDFFGWVSPEPNNHQGPEHCMEIMHQNATGAIQPLNDAPCNVEKAFICARDPIAVQIQ